MARYAIGDLHGMAKCLDLLLEKLAFNPNRDELWFVGDLVNKGKDNLAILKKLKKYHEQGIAKIVLGNHDLALLGCYYGIFNLANNTFADLLSMVDAKPYINWLYQLPFIYLEDNLIMVHAGIHPSMDSQNLDYYQKLVQNYREKRNHKDYLVDIFSQPTSHWGQILSSKEQVNFIANCFTRIRYCDGDHSMVLQEQKDSCMRPWYELCSLPKDKKIVFGHWAALNGLCPRNNIYATDTGCVYGRKLTGLCLDTFQRTFVQCG